MTRRAFPVDWTAATIQPTHAGLVRDITRYLRISGWFVIQLPRGGLPHEPGAPDMLAFKAGRALFIEAKVGRDKLSVDQERVRESVMAQGFEYREVRSLEDVMRSVGAL